MTAPDAVSMTTPTGERRVIAARRANENNEAASCTAARAPARSVASRMRGMAMPASAPITIITTSSSVMVVPDLGGGVIGG
ncbi:MAG: hypothetical protein ABIR92_07110 [Gemmatimonadaceae bacterium]